MFLSPAGGRQIFGEHRQVTIPFIRNLFLWGSRDKRLRGTMTSVKWLSLVCALLRYDCLVRSARSPAIERTRVGYVTCRIGSDRHETSSLAGVCPQDHPMALVACLAGERP